jgi:uncharacterized membrane protein (Fun14 family)
LREYGGGIEMGFTAGFLIGTFLGMIIGVSVVSLMVVAKDGDDISDKYKGRW